jgi:hypothetical protein
VSINRLVAIVLIVVTADLAFAQSIPSGMLKIDTIPSLPKVAATELQIRGFDRPSIAPAVAYTFMSNKTRLVASPGTPLQVVYTAPDGAAALWFPHSGEVRHGRWHVEDKRWDLTENGVAIKTRHMTSVCFNYGGSIPNIFAREGLRSPSCLSLNGRQAHTLDRRDGDVFALADRQGRKPLGVINIRKLDELRTLQ